MIRLRHEMSGDGHATCAFRFGAMLPHKHHDGDDVDDVDDVVMVLVRLATGARGGIIDTGPGRSHDSHLYFRTWQRTLV